MKLKHIFTGTIFALLCVTVYSAGAGLEGIESRVAEIIAKDREVSPNIRAAAAKLSSSKLEEVEDAIFDLQVENRPDLLAVALSYSISQIQIKAAKALEKIGTKHEVKPMLEILIQCREGLFVRNAEMAIANRQLIHHLMLAINHASGRRLGDPNETADEEVDRFIKNASAAVESSRK